MKTLYFTISLILTILVLVIAFGNVAANCSNLHFLFFPVRQNPTIIFLALAFLGVLTGVFYTKYFQALLEKKEEDDDEDF